MLTISATLVTITVADADLMQRFVAFSTIHRGWILPLAFIIGALKSTPLVNMFIPSTGMFVALAAAYGAGGGTFVPLWLTATGGATAGDVVFYWLGHRYRHRITKIWPVSRAPDLFARGEGAFHRWGIWSVLGAKFITPIRPFIPLIAGIYRMHFALFLAATNASSLIWAGIGMGAGFGLWQMTR